MERVAIEIGDRGKSKAAPLADSIPPRDDPVVGPTTAPGLAAPGSRARQTPDVATLAQERDELASQVQQISSHLASLEALSLIHI